VPPFGLIEESQVIFAWDFMVWSLLELRHGSFKRVEVPIAVVNHIIIAGVRHMNLL